MAIYQASLPLVAKKGDSGYTDAAYMGKLVSVSSAPSSFDVKLYGDDGVAERVKGVSEITLTINTTTIPLDVAAMIFGNTYSSSDETITRKTEDLAPVCGFGFIYTELVDGTSKYFVKYYPAVTFAVPSESYSTQGETVSFGTPSFTATAQGDSSKIYEKTIECETAAAAKTKLQTLLNYT